MSYGDYLEQPTYLLFLKVDDENRQISRASAIPDEYSWQSLFARDGNDLEIHYRTILTELGTGSGLIPVIFRSRAYPYADLIARDKANLDIFWLRDESLEDTASLPNPDVLAAEIAEDLQAALEQFGEIAEDLQVS